jgi:hypothetical protein
MRWPRAPVYDAPRLEPQPEQLEAEQPPQDEPADDENAPAPVEKDTTDRQRVTSVPWQRGHSTCGSRENTSSSKSVLHAAQ